MSLTAVRDRIRRKRAWMRRQRRGIVPYESEYLKWMSFAVAGMLDPGHRHLIDTAVHVLPTDDPLLEIGAFAGLSTNLISYFLRLHGRNNDLLTTDPWIFEGEELVTIPESTKTFVEYRARIRKQFEENVRFWSVDRLPYAFDLASDDLFAAWRAGAIVTDVFGRERRLGGPICFCFVDGDHRYDQVRRDFLNVDGFLVPGGFLLFDDSDEFGAFPDVYRVVREAIDVRGYELIAENPHHLLRKPL
jgi:hypothetical protein